VRICRRQVLVLAVIFDRDLHRENGQVSQGQHEGGKKD
jgi:hypothetical protein